MKSYAESVKLPNLIANVAHNSAYIRKKSSKSSYSENLNVEGHGRFLEQNDSNSEDLKDLKHGTYYNNWPIFFIK